MSLKSYRFDGGKELDLSKLPTDARWEKAGKNEILKRTEENLAAISELQEKLYADGRESVVLVLQAMDAAGKDSTVKNVMNGVNPAGVDVVSFKQPTSEELAHDYLWRVVKAMPTRGKMGIFNRSYYEDVLVVKVQALQKGYQMAHRVVEDPNFFEKRYRQIRHFEEYFYDNSYRIVKVFLHISSEKQKERFLERIDDPAKNWKFSSSDLKARAHWDEYMRAYEDAINATATPENPWYVIPADQKWYTRYLVSEALLEALQACDPHFPELPAVMRENLAVCKALLEGDSGKPDGPEVQAKRMQALEAAARAGMLPTLPGKEKRGKEKKKGKKTQAAPSAAKTPSDASAPAEENAPDEKAAACKATPPKRRGRPPKKAAEKPEAET